LVDVADLSIANGLEEMELFAARNVVTDGSVSTDKFHVPELTLSKIVVDTVVVPIVLIAEKIAALPREQQNEREAFGSAYSSLFLTAIYFVEVSAAANAPGR